ncbi:MAG: PKD domain-containing protein [Bacteroidales bacterium]|nr:PKD domain-containing protein [Bacteroidales bacterium]
MKKFLFVVSLVFVTSIVFGQQVDRNKVLVEIGTGTWCTYCPGAAMGADDLIANGHPVAIIENHNGDPFANQYSNARNSYYGITGYPTAFFDGGNSVVGGSHSSSMYSSYAPIVTARAAVPSDFILKLYGTNAGAAYDMVVKIYKVGSYSGPDPVYHLAVTESDIQYAWQGQSELNFVNRQMIPDQFGTTVSFADSDTVTLNLSFNMGGWVLAHVEFVGFLQRNDTKEVLQAMKVPASFLPPPPMPPVTEFEASATSTCEGYEVQFTDLSTNNPTAWAWAFPGGTPETSNDENPVVIYETEGVYDVTLVATNAAGSNEMLKEDYMDISFTPEQPAITEEDFVLVSSATEGNQWYLDEEVIDGATGQTYEPIQNGTYTLTVTQGNCTSDFSAEHTVMWVGIAEQFSNKLVKAYPTPNQGKFTLEINTPTADVYSMRIYDASNSAVYQEDNIQVNASVKKQIDLGSLPNGIYFMILQGSNGQYFQKIVIRK